MTYDAITDNFNLNWITEKILHSVNFPISYTNCQWETSISEKNYQHVIWTRLSGDSGGKDKQKKVLDAIVKRQVGKSNLLIFASAIQTREGNWSWVAIGNRKWCIDYPTSSFTSILRLISMPEFFPKQIKKSFQAKLNQRWMLKLYTRIFSEIANLLSNLFNFFFHFNLMKFALLLVKSEEIIWGTFFIDSHPFL